MINFNPKDRYGFEDLVEIMAILRSPEGCPWDREQTHKSIRNNFLEEVYEAVDAIDHKDTANLREELGDVMMQVVFHAQIAREEGLFGLEDVLDEVCQKLIRRHPHIFGTVSANTSQEVLKNWDAIKRQEKGQNSVSDTLRQVPTALPALMHRSFRAGPEKAAFPWRPSKAPWRRWSRRCSSWGRESKRSRPWAGFCLRRPFRPESRDFPPKKR